MRVNSFSFDRCALRAVSHSARETILCGCMVTSCDWSTEIGFELVERAGPTGVVAIARRLIEEFFVPQRQQRAGAFTPELDGYQRLALWRRTPGPGVDQLLAGN